MTRIVDVKAREILDSRGNPTVEVDVVTENGVFRRLFFSLIMGEWDLFQGSQFHFFTDMVLQTYLPIFKMRI